MAGMRVYQFIRRTGKLALESLEGVPQDRLRSSVERRRVESADSIPLRPILIVKGGELCQRTGGRV